jgi:hypothetical protein
MIETKDEERMERWLLWSERPVRVMRMKRKIWIWGGYLEV